MVRDFWRDTFDGSEIRQSPVEVGSLSSYLQGFILVQDITTLWVFVGVIGVARDDLCSY